MSHNINQFLTSQSGPVYSKIMDILHKFQRTQFDGISPKVYIYGSFVRDLIQHYYNPTKKFNFNNFNNFNNFKTLKLYLCNIYFLYNIYK